MAERSSETKFTCYSSREMVENPSEFADKVASLLDITIPSHIDVNNIVASCHSKSSDCGDYRHPDLQMRADTKQYLEKFLMQNLLNY